MLVRNVKSHQWRREGRGAGVRGGVEMVDPQCAHISKGGGNKQLAPLNHTDTTRSSQLSQRNHAAEIIGVARNLEWGTY